MSSSGNPVFSPANARSRNRDAVSGGRDGIDDRRSARSYLAIIDATLSLLRHSRYGDLTIEAVAARAGVGKATLYRHWPSKGALVAEAISSTMRVDDPPETDDFRADLIAALQISVVNYARPPGGVLFGALLADVSDDEALLHSFLENFVLPRRRVVTNLIRRGIKEGRVASDCDPELLMDMWAGALVYRALLKHAPVTDEIAERMVDAVLEPLPDNEVTDE